MVLFYERQVSKVCAPTEAFSLFENKINHSVLSYANFGVLQIYSVSLYKYTLKILYSTLIINISIF